jgi:hypothetical protein
MSLKSNPSFHDKAAYVLSFFYDNYCKQYGDTPDMWKFDEINSYFARKVDNAKPNEISEIRRQVEAYRDVFDHYGWNPHATL